ncbi:MAG TPA: methionyl-tRNA formyltransferase [Candidatus Acidoferrales bacterium]|nr:methionyl-tRNA formyltransferase [Candidatus Acidoferrales bacterium]
MRVVFAGSAEFSIPVLRSLATSSHDVVAVLTAPDRPGSRGSAAPRPVKAEAISLELPVEQPPRLTEEFWREAIVPTDPDALVVAAYGQLIPLVVLQSLAQGGVGVHPSLLPRHRGASPVPAAILAGDSRSGVTVFRMDQRMDAGPILAQEAIPVPGSATTSSLTARLAQLGAQLVVQVLDRLEGGDSSDIPQLASGATFSHRLSRQDGSLEWTLTAAEIDRRLRALAPWPGVTVPLEGVRVKLLRGAPDQAADDSADAVTGRILEQGADWILVRTAEDAFRVELIQPPGKPPMTPAAFLRGRPRASGSLRRG